MGWPVTAPGASAKILSRVGTEYSLSPPVADVEPSRADSLYRYDLKDTRGGGGNS